MKNNTVQKNIPNGWVVKKMDDFIKEGAITLGRGEVISKTDLKNYPGENPIYSSSVKNNALFGTYSKYMFDEELITWSVDGGGDFFYRPKHKFSVTNVSGYLKADQKQFDYKFLSYYLQEEHSKKSFDYQNKAHPSVIRELYEIAKPHIKEQQKISEILGAVDEDIAKTQKVIEATEKLKRGLMQQLFTRGIGHIKFKEAALEKALDAVIDHRGLTPKKLGGEWVEDGIPAISAMNVKNGEIVKPETIRYVDEALFRRWMPEGIEPDDVLLTSEAPLGEAYLVKPEDKYCLSQRLFALRPRKDELVGAYLYYFLISSAGQKRLLERATGSTAKGIRQTELLKIAISFPDTEEQKRVAEILSAVDEKISVNKKLKAKITLLKKGLMQDLLSGAKRVKV